MPRTKRPVRKTQDKSDGEPDIVKKFNKLVAEQKKAVELRCETEIRDIELAFKIFISSQTDEMLNKTIGELKTELHFNKPKRNVETELPTRSVSRDDGYLTEGSQGLGDSQHAKKSSAAPTRRRSRSADPLARKPPMTVYRSGGISTQRRRSRSVYKTPAYSRGLPPSSTYPVITPKVAPQTPLTLLRQPRQGEMVVSMSGSPVMVPAFHNMQPDEKANCNIKLCDGTMLSLQPRQFKESEAHIPFGLMDSNVLHQLITLKENIDKVVKLGVKVIK